MKEYKLLCMGTIDRYCTEEELCNFFAVGCIEDVETILDEQEEFIYGIEEV